MALQKTKELPNGTSGNYWRVIEVNINYDRLQSHIVIGLYKDQQARNDGKTIMLNEFFDWQGIDFPFDFTSLNKQDNNAVKIAYEKIKILTSINSEGVETVGFFNDATDI